MNRESPSATGSGGDGGGVAGCFGELLFWLSDSSDEDRAEEELEVECEKDF